MKNKKIEKARKEARKINWGILIVVIVASVIVAGIILWRVSMRMSPDEFSGKFSVCSDVDGKSSFEQQQRTPSSVLYFYSNCTKIDDINPKGNLPSDCSFTISLVDYCTGKELHEYVCLDNGPVEKRVNCSVRCSGGACVG